MSALKINILKLPYNMWLILIGTFLTSATYWMTWPFLAVILNQQYHLSSSAIGGLLSISVLISTLAGVYLGNLSDRIGRAKMMIFGSIISAIAFTFLAFASNLTLYFIAIALVALSRAVLDPLSKAIFGDMTEDSKDRAGALHLRYFIVNLGAACGPLIGVYMGIAAQQSTFFITALSFLVYLFFLYPVLVSKKISAGSSASKQCGSRHTFSKTLRLLMLDNAFMVLVVINILLWIVFVQFESTVALYFSVLKLPTLAKMVSIMIFTNTVTIILLQFPLLALMKNISVVYRIYISIAILGISQLMFAFSPPESYLFWIVSTIIFSIAEVILVPNLNIVIDQMAPNDLRGSYFAASFLYRIGSGAYIGGVLLQFVGGKGLFLSMFFVCLIIAGLYFYSSKLHRPEFISI